MSQYTKDFAEAVRRCNGGTVAEIVETMQEIRAERIAE
jgi:hypothetical protein